MEVAALIEGVEFGNLAQGVLDCSPVVEGATLGVDHAIPRIDRKKLNVIRAFFTKEGEELIEEEGGGQDGWSGVIEKSVAAEDAGATAMVGLTFEQSDLMAEGAEAEGGGEPAEAGANNEGVGGGGCDSHGTPLQVFASAVRWKMAGSRIPAARAARCGEKGAGNLAEEEAISSHRR